MDGADGLELRTPAITQVVPGREVVRRTLAEAPGRQNNTAFGNLKCVKQEILRCPFISFLKVKADYYYAKKRV